MSNEANAYISIDLPRLSNVRSIRLRPGMYIGDTGPRGLTHLIHEWIDFVFSTLPTIQSLHLRIELLSDGACRITDTSPGLWTLVPDGKDKTWLEDLMANLAVPDFLLRNPLYSAPFRVTAACVSALSSRLLVETSNNGILWQQEFAQGVPISALQAMGVATATGNRITFWPDRGIFSESATFQATALEDAFRALTFVNPGLRIELVDQRAGSPVEVQFHHPAGLVDGIRYLNRNSTPLHPTVFSLVHEDEIGKLAVAIQWGKGANELCLGYVNNLHIQAGTHITGLRRALTRVLTREAHDRGWLDPLQPAIAGAYYRAGIRAIVAVGLKEPTFEGPTRATLANPEVAGWILHALFTPLREFFSAHPGETQRIWEQAYHLFQTNPRLYGQLKLDPFTGIDP